jgi:hypothetical protein
VSREATYLYKYALQFNYIVGGFFVPVAVAVALRIVQFLLEG